MACHTVPTNFLDDVVSYVEVSSLTTKRAMDEVDVHRKAQEKAAALRPALLKHMIASGVVKQAHVQTAEVMLGAHDTTMQLLKAATDRIAELAAQLSASEKKASELGQAEPDRGAAQPAYHAVGSRSAEVRDSDRPLMRLAGIN